MGDFTQEAEAVIQRAKVEAKNRRSCYVEDTDILLALLKCAREEPVSARLKETIGVSYFNVLEKAPRHDNECYVPDNAPWTVHAQNALNEARATAKKLGHRYCEA